MTAVSQESRGRAANAAFPANAIETGKPYRSTALTRRMLRAVV